MESGVAMNEARDFKRDEVKEHIEEQRAQMRERMEEEIAERKKVKFSMKLKIIAVVFCAVIETALVVMLVAIPQIKSNMRETTQSYMLDMARANGQSMDRQLSAMGADSALSRGALGEAVGNVSINGMDSSYAYVVSADGTMLYHPTADKIGQPVENAAVTQLVADLAAGKMPVPGVIEYDFKGVTKYAAYYIGTDAQYILVVTADESDAFSAVNGVVRNVLIAALIATIVLAFLTMLIAAAIVRPIQKMTKVLRGISDLDFRENPELMKAMKRTDECGVMAESIEILRKELSTVSKQIVDKSAELHEASVSLSSGTDETASNIEQVEKAVGEIAQGATSQAQETATATENIIVIGNMIEETNVEVENLRETMRTMRDAGNHAMDTLKELSEINLQTKAAMQVIYEQTNVTNESAMKIKDATDIITDIAEETNLLSLNASIEAARAGEQGRGFAVVAGQIQKLAEQSNESARRIAEIIGMLLSESEKSVQTMEEVKVVIEKQDANVAETEEAFGGVKEGIHDSIEGIRAISAKTTKLDEARVKVVDVVQNLTAISEENAASTEETAASISEVGAIVTDIAGNAAGLNRIADALEDTVSAFVTE